MKKFEDENEQDNISDVEVTDEPKKRGRPRKHQIKELTETTTAPSLPRKRGRPPKQKLNERLEDQNLNTSS